MIAEKLGIPKTAMIRARAGISYALLTRSMTVTAACPADELLKLAEELLEIPTEILEDAINLELGDGMVVADTIGERAVRLHAEAVGRRAEHRRAAPGTAGRPAALAGHRGRQGHRVGAERRLGVTLAESQQAAVRMALASKVVVITGGPGVGKTTLVNAILKILAAKRVEVAAGRTDRPGGQADDRGDRPGSQDHPPAAGVRSRRWRLQADEENPLDCNLLVLDETSMVDVPILAATCSRRCRNGSAVILVGDVDQLPSVGPGQVLADIIGSGMVPVVRLTEVFRQAAESRIITNAHRINAGLMPEPGNATPAADFYFVDARRLRGRPARWSRWCRTASRPVRVRRHPGHPGAVPDEPGRAGSPDAERRPPAAPEPRPVQPQVERFGWTFRPGDKVMQIANDYDKEVFNGDLGFVTTIDVDAGEVVADFDGRDVVYQFGELDEVSLAYATTIHKARARSTRPS